MIKEEDLHEIGMFAKPHGVKGEISLITDYDLSGVTGDIYIVCNIDNIYVPFFVDSFRNKSVSNTLIKFDNLDSEDKVKFLTGKPAFMQAELLPLRDERPVRRKMLTGYTIVDDNYGIIGTVNDLDDSTLNILLKVDCKGVEILIPLPLITSIHHHHQTINTSLPEGFIELFKINNETAQ